jgi:hypothetical protein
MNVKTFSEWLYRQGHRIIETESSFWYDQGPRVYQAFPYHWSIQPSEQELRKLLIGEKAVGLRYSTSLDTTWGKISYHVVLNDTSYTLEMLSANARSVVRRGLKSCQVQRISMERLALEGWRLQYDTLERQSRASSQTQAEWQRICLAAQDLPGFEAWAATIDGELAAAMLTAQVDDVWYILYPLSHRQYLRRYVNNALSYIFTQEIMSRPGVKTIFSGLHSLDAPDSIDRFKFRMGYTAMPVRQRVIFHPWLAPAFNSSSHAIINQMLRWYPRNPTLAKAEGMIRFYLEGKRGPYEQTWPGGLINRKVELLKSLSENAKSDGAEPISLHRSA